VWLTWDLEREGKRRVGKDNMSIGPKTTTGFTYEYQVACMISFIVLACMAHGYGFLVMIFHWHGGLPGLTMVFPSLAISYVSKVLWVLYFFFHFVLIFLMVLG